MRDVRPPRRSQWGRGAARYVSKLYRMLHRLDAYLRRRRRMHVRVLVHARLVRLIGLVLVVGGGQLDARKHVV